MTTKITAESLEAVTAILVHDTHIGPEATGCICLCGRVDKFGVETALELHELGWMPFSLDGNCLPRPLEYSNHTSKYHHNPLHVLSCHKPQDKFSSTWPGHETSLQGLPVQLQFCSWFGMVQVPHAPTWWWLSRIIWSRTILKYAKLQIPIWPLVFKIQQIQQLLNKRQKQNTKGARRRHGISVNIGTLHYNRDIEIWLHISAKEQHETELHIFISEMLLGQSSTSWAKFSVGFLIAVHNQVKKEIELHLQSAYPVKKVEQQSVLSHLHLVHLV